MNLLELQRKMIAAARAQTPDERVPYAFEKRVMALIRARNIADGWALWGRALWRAAAPCVIIAVLFGAWALLSPAPRTGDLSQALETTLLASVDQSDQAP